MAMVDLDFVKTYVRMCNDGWLQGWHERNGGNLTYRLSEKDVEAARSFLASPASGTRLALPCPTWRGSTSCDGLGKYLRNVALDPEANIGICELDEKGERWRVVWGLPGSVPTSEFPTHLMNHSVRKRVTGGTNRVIYHCHATNVIALTYVLPLTDRDFTRALWQSATECPVVFPEGVGVVPWMVPGGVDIARATSKKMETYQAAIWAMHGLFVSGPDFDTAFGLAHTIEKSADVYVRVLSCGGVRQTITDDDLRAIARDFGVTLNPAML